MNIPPHIKIGSNRIEVILTKEVNEANDDGEFNPRTRTININEGLHEDEQGTVFVHEVLHACCHLAEIEGKLSEEEFVSRVAPWLREFIVQNL